MRARSSGPRRAGGQAGRSLASQFSRMPRSLSDQVVAITGASSGVGRAVARAFGASGAKVGLIARGVDGLNAAAEEIVRAGGEALVLPTDVSHAAGLQKAAHALVDKWG